MTSKSRKMIHMFSFFFYKKKKSKKENEEEKEERRIRIIRKRSGRIRP